MPFPRGLYDLFLTDAVARLLDGDAPNVPDVRDLDNEEVAERLTEALGRQLRALLDHLGTAHDERVRATRTGQRPAHAAPGHCRQGCSPSSACCEGRPDVISSGGAQRRGCHSERSRQAA